MSVFEWFFDWLEDLEERKEWEAAGKPYYIKGDDGKYKRVSSLSYENYLLDNGFSPRAARQYMKDHGHDPDLPLPVVMADDDGEGDDSRDFDYYIGPYSDNDDD